MRASRCALLAVPFAWMLLLACGGGDGRTVPAGTGTPGSPATAPVDGAAAAADPNAPPPAATTEVTLYFADEAGSLQPEPREIDWEGPPSEQARRLVQALLDGPSGGAGRLSVVMPSDATLRASYLDDQGTAYLDFDTAFARGLSAGSQDALVALRSIADTLAANLPEVRRVKILVEGEEVVDFGGHLDLSRPVVPGIVK